MIDKEFTAMTKQDFTDACSAQDVEAACQVIANDFAHNVNIQAPYDVSPVLGKILGEAAQDEENNHFVEKVLDYVARTLPEEDKLHLAARDGASITDNADIVNYVDVAISKQVENEAMNDGGVPAELEGEFLADDDIDPDAWGIGNDDADDQLGGQSFNVNYN